MRIDYVGHDTVVVGARAQLLMPFPLDLGEFPDEVKDVARISGPSR